MLFELLAQADGDGLHRRALYLGLGWSTGLVLSHPELVGEVVHLLSELEGRVGQGGEESPAVMAERLVGPSAHAGSLAAPPPPAAQLGGAVDGQGLLAHDGPAQGVPVEAALGAVDGGLPVPLAVQAPGRMPPPAALALQQPGEGSLKLLAGARVDDGVYAAVEVTQPEDHLENHVRRLDRREESAWKIIEGKTKT